MTSSHFFLATGMMTPFSFFWIGDKIMTNRSVPPRCCNDDSATRINSGLSGESLPSRLQQQLYPKSTGAAAAAASFADDTNSSSERCGFVGHVMVLCLGALYTVYVARNTSVTSSSTAIWPETTTAPMWTMVLPVLAMVVFFLIPVTYGILNAALATPSRADALETIQDSFSVPAPPPPAPSTAVISGEKRNATTAFALPQWYFRNAFQENWNEDGDGSLPEICDLDVAHVNDLVSNQCLSS
jgi:PIG-P